MGVSALFTRFSIPKWRAVSTVRRHAVSNHQLSIRTRAATKGGDSEARNPSELPTAGAFTANGSPHAARGTHGERLCAMVKFMSPALTIEQLTKTYASGLVALKAINLEIRKGDIFALLGPNGAGKSTLINIVCGCVTSTSGVVLVDGHDIVHDYRVTRSKIGLVPQELTTDAFETVWATVNFSRGLFGCAPNRAYIEKLLRDLSLWDKQNDRIMSLSGGMKRRVMMAKALSHEPEILFLDEPTAGVDVELRRDMWMLVRSLRDRGVTVILTTHYIDEAEELADRIGIISKGELIVVEEKATLMQKLGKRRLTLTLQEIMQVVPVELQSWPLSLSNSGDELEYTFDTKDERANIPLLLKRLDELGITFRDLSTRESSLEEIFVSLVSDRGGAVQ